MELSSKDVRDKRFAVTRWRSGYREAEIDEFLDRAARTLDDLARGRRSEASVTGRDVRSCEFSVGRGGYDEMEVDDFLDDLEESLDLAHRRYDERHGGATHHTPSPTTRPTHDPRPPASLAGVNRARPGPPRHLRVAQVLTTLLLPVGVVLVFLANERPAGFTALVVGGVAGVLVQLRIFAHEDGHGDVP